MFADAESHRWQIDRNTYTLIPTRICKWDQIAIGIQGLRLDSLDCRHWHNSPALSLRLHNFLLLLWWRYRWCRWRGLNLLGIQGADLELGFVFLEDAFVVVFPELLGCVLSRDTSEDLLPAWTRTTIN
jgi:hypothetical protein